jgi:ribosomal protein S18 acetylase RimI-like enzyme
MESLLAYARWQGCQAGYLQVMDNNPAANRLYRQLGFKSAYKYWYRIKAKPDTI